MYTCISGLIVRQLQPTDLWEKQTGLNPEIRSDSPSGEITFTGSAFFP